MAGIPIEEIIRDVQMETDKDNALEEDYDAARPSVYPVHIRFMTTKNWRYNER